MALYFGSYIFVRIRAYCARSLCENHIIMGTFSAISLFSGAGGMDLGFESSGFSIQWANDFNKSRLRNVPTDLAWPYRSWTYTGFDGVEGIYRCRPRFWGSSVRDFRSRER